MLTYIEAKQHYSSENKQNQDLWGRAEACNTKTTHLEVLTTFRKEA